MTTADLLYEKAKQLPENLIVETLHYMDFLAQKWQSPVFDDVKSKTQTEMEETKLEKRKRLSQLMHEISERGTAFSDIDDVMAWQREVRTDKVLVGREND